MNNTDLLEVMKHVTMRGPTTGKNKNNCKGFTFFADK
jgi:hypothetical protein